MVFDGSDYWFAALVLRRGIALVYLIAFIAAYRQARPLIGTDGITPFTEITERVSFRDRPSLFHRFPTDRALEWVTVAGIVLSALSLAGIPARFGALPAAAVWLVLWGLYLSLVNVGRVWYGYGWESMLLEAGFLAVFLGGLTTAASGVIIVLVRWMLFRVMFGAGLIKLRGDDCWKDLSCLDHHYETQPMPNPLSWFLHHLPSWWHRVETAVTHLVQLGAPLLYFLPQPFAMIGGLATIGFQAALMVGGNYSWLNLLTIVLAASTLPDALFTAVLPVTAPAVSPMAAGHQVAVAVLAGVVVYRSRGPVLNMLSSDQAMNTSFDPLHLVNSYGAFGSITRERYELVIQGRQDGGDWRTYAVPGKPTDPEQCPPQIAPYHGRLGWQLWFAAMYRHPRRPWFRSFLVKLLENDPGVRRLLADDPFPEDGPDEVRVRRYRYEFTDMETLRSEGRWWERELVNEFVRPVTLSELRPSSIQSFSSS